MYVLKGSPKALIRAFTFLNSLYVRGTSILLFALAFPAGFFGFIKAPSSDDGTVRQLLIFSCFTNNEKQLKLTKNNRFHFGLRTRSGSGCAAICFAGC